MLKTERHGAVFGQFANVCPLRLALVRSAEGYLMSDGASTRRAALRKEDLRAFLALVFLDEPIERRADSV